MPRKTYLTFLGTNNYINCNYYTEGEPTERVEDVKYVQEALLQLYCRNFGEGDVAYFFLTKDARRQNWDNNGQWNRETGKYNLPNIGLQQRLLDLKKAGFFSGKIQAVDIPEGFSSDEIWHIFQIVFGCLEQGDEVILDITHAFRSLPMLGMVLINYAKSLKNVSIKAIYYGAFEKLGPAPVVAKRPLKERNAPILNLTNFSELQDWTAAAREFINLGKADGLAGLVIDSQPGLARQLLLLEQSIATCRGKLLTQKLDIQSLKNTLTGSMNEPIKEQLKPLLSKIEEKIAPFENGKTLKNGFAAVEWCIQHKMVQQGITFLQESIVSHVVEQFAGKGQLNDLFYREIAATALQLFPVKGNRHFEGTFLEKPTLYKKRVKTLYTEMRNYVKEKEPLSDLFWELTGKDGFRNDINHCGFRDNFISANKLNLSLKQLFDKIKQLNL